MLSDYLVRKLVNKMMLPAPCALCSTTKGRILVHHKDKNKQNNNPSNLQVVCNPCHARVHFKGVPFTEEHKRKIGLNSKKKLSGRKLTEEHKRNISLHNARWTLRKHLSEETKRKISVARMGQASAFKGKHHTEETKKILRLQHLGFRHSKETLEKMRMAKLGAKNSSYGKPRSKETRRKISMAARKRWKAHEKEISQQIDLFVESAKFDLG